MSTACYNGNNTKTVVTLGEIMLRLSPPLHQRIAFAREFEACYAGGEANVAVSIANYGLRASFVSMVPDNELGTAALRSLRGFGVDVSHVVRSGDRLGVYFVEHGVSARSSKVLYDRARSAIAEADEHDFDFENIFAGKHWLHVSGITPALSKNSASLTLAALQAAKHAGLTVSFDLNYRKKLWTPDKAQRVCIPLMEYVDVCIGNEEDAEKVLGFAAKDTHVASGTLNVDRYKEMFIRLQDRFGFSVIATTLRESKSASDNGWSALLHDRDNFYHSRTYDLHIVDRVGSGDSFSGALIYALLTNKSPQNAIEFATAASALKHTIHGDYNQVSVSEVETLAAGDGSGRVER